ncbi:MAG: oligosaccharide flippase family protein [Roseibacillus sp.]
MNVGGNVIWALSETVVRIFVTFFVNVLIARHLGPENYGVLTAAFITVTWAMTFAALGLDTVVIREISAKDFKVPEILGVAALFRLFSATLSIIVIGVLIFRSGMENFFSEPYSMWAAVAIMSPLIFFQPLSYTMANTFSAFLRADILTRAKLSGLAFATGGRIVGLVLGLPFVYFAFCHLVEHLVATVAGIWGYRKNVAKQVGAWKISKGVAERLYQDGRWLFASACVVCIIQGSGVLLLKGLSNEFETGIYSAALRLAMVFQFVPAVLCKTFLPLISGQGKGVADENVATLERELFRLLWLFGYSVALFFLFFGDLLVPFILGAEYQEASDSLKILSVVLIPLSVGAARSIYFAKDRSYKKLLITDVTGAFFTVALGLLLVPRYGATGAAVSALVAAVIGYLIVPYVILERGKESSRTVLKGALFPFPNFKILFKAKLSS